MKKQGLQSQEIGIQSHLSQTKDSPGSTRPNLSELDSLTCQMTRSNKVPKGHSHVISDAKTLSSKCAMGTGGRGVILSEHIMSNADHTRRDQTALGIQRRFQKLCISHSFRPQGLGRERRGIWKGGKKMGGSPWPLQ